MDKKPVLKKKKALAGGAPTKKAPTKTNSPKEAAPSKKTVKSSAAAAGVESTAPLQKKKKRVETKDATQQQPSSSAPPVKVKSALKASSRVAPLPGGSTKFSAPIFAAEEDDAPQATKAPAKKAAPVAVPASVEDDYDDGFGGGISVLGVNTAAPTQDDLLSLLSKHRKVDAETAKEEAEYDSYVKESKAAEAQRKMDELEKRRLAHVEAAAKHQEEQKKAGKKSKISVRTVAPGSSEQAENMKLAMERLFAAPPSEPTPKAAEKEEEEEEEEEAPKPKAAIPAGSTSPEILEALHARIKRPLQDTMKITQLTRVQQLSWMPMMEEGKDVLVRSETGSGKTLSYSLPLLHRLLTRCDTKPIDRSSGTLVIVMVPTRELAQQVSQVLEVLCRNARFVVVGAIHGGDDRHKEKARLRKGIHILVATPGRLLDHLKTTNSFIHNKLETVVFDEADRLLDMGFERAIREIMGIIKPSKRILVSATITNAVERLSHVALRNPVHVGETEDVFKVPKSLRQHYSIVPCKHRLVTLSVFLLGQLAAGSRKIVVFCSTSDAVEFHYLLLSRCKNPFLRDEKGAGTEGKYQLGEKRRRTVNRKLTERANEGGDNVVTFDDDDLDEGEDEEMMDQMDEANAAQAKGIDPASQAEKKASGLLDNSKALFKTHMYKLHGNMSQVDRASVFHGFKTSEEPGILFCTDVAARGLDMPKIDWIVHYDPPTDERCYVHRVGRTARIGTVGDSIMFLQPHEQRFAQFIEQHVDVKLGEKRHEAFLLYLSSMDKNSRNYWGQSQAILQRQLAWTVNNDDSLTRVALFAYQSFIRAYASVPGPVKQYFIHTELHLGHVANSFGIDAKPSEVREKLRMDKDLKDERALGRDKTRFREGGAGMAVDNKQTYHSTLVKQHVQKTKEYVIEEKEKNKNVPKLFQFTEFDA